MNRRFIWSCYWSEDDDGIWQTSCGNAFVFTADGPIENGFKNCPYCGRYLQTKEYLQTAPDNQS